MHFTKLDDSPMFRKQIESLEEGAESLRERSLKFYKGCRKYTEALGEAYDGDIAFAGALEMFGGGHNDPISVAFGGPVMTKFTIALREIGTYKEVLRSQLLNNGWELGTQIITFDLGLSNGAELAQKWSKSELGRPKRCGFSICLDDVLQAKSVEFSYRFPSHLVLINYWIFPRYSVALGLPNPKILFGCSPLSIVEHMLNDRLLNFVNMDLHDVKEARKRFDKTSLTYDQAREKFLSLKKGTKIDVVTVLEEELYHARSQFEQARFNLVGALSNVEAKKRFEFLEAVSGTMDAHLRYFKQGYELLHQMEPYINQVLTYAQQSRERANYEQAALTERMQDYKRQIDRESRWSNGSYGSPNGDGIQTIGRSSHKMIEAVMQSAAKGKVQTIRQGYLSKRSSNLRGDWKRRFFVLDSRGMLYYYRKQSKPSISGNQISNQRSNSSDLGSGLLSRWLSSHYHGGVHDEKAVAHHTVNLLTSTIKVDADQSDLRFCFRIISPSKNYTLQAESAMDQMDWIEKITGVIASLLSSQTPEHHFPVNPMAITMGHRHSPSETSSFESSSDFDHQSIEEYTSERNLVGSRDRSSRGSIHQRSNVKGEKPIDVLRRVPGNDICADCGASEPDWASLNLGVLVCIECSGVHRNLGVHISKVRSLTLDVKVWEPSVIALFQSLGNAYANSIWEELLNSGNTGSTNETPRRLSRSDKSQLFPVNKPCSSDPISIKEKFIHAKYAEKLFVCQPKEEKRLLCVANTIWESVRTNDKKAVYRHIVTSGADLNSVHGQASFSTSLTLAKVMLLPEPPQDPPVLSRHSSGIEEISTEKEDEGSASRSEEHNFEEFLDGCSLLHLACQTADIGMVELLLQYSANINAPDSRGRTPLHHCVLRGRTVLAKLLHSRGADGRATDMDGRTVLQYAEDASITDDELLVLLADTKDTNRCLPNR